MIWFTADYHLGHKNIIKYCERPFKNVKEMDKTIIRNHNSRVKPNDTVYFLGDFCFRNTNKDRKAERYIKKLNGRFVFIRGNHDNNNSLKTRLYACIINMGNMSIFLVHNPINYMKNYHMTFHGHVHGLWKFKYEKDNHPLVNVGVDVWNFMPVTFNEIMKEFQRWKKIENQYLKK